MNERSPIERRFLDYLEQAARYSLTDEVSATPKPGLVDRADSGAHRDMDYQTFLVSIDTILPCIRQMAETGVSWTSGSLPQLFSAIRPAGIQGEQAMFRATGGVNTHKGIIFSMGLTAAAAGLLFSWKTAGGRFRLCAGEILGLCRELCAGKLMEDFASIPADQPRTHGELLYLKYGCRGIRGEAADGFPAVRDVGLPALRSALAAAEKQGVHFPFATDCSRPEWNAICLDVLLHLMAEVDDSNILYRTDYESLSYVKAQAAQALLPAGRPAFLEEHFLKEMNRDFIRRNLSPGGCADLLSLTLFLWRLEQLSEPFFK